MEEKEYIYFMTARVPCTVDLYFTVKADTEEEAKKLVSENPRAYMDEDFDSDQFNYPTFINLTPEDVKPND